MRKDLKELQERKSLLYDKQRQAAVEKRHQKGFRTARENIQDLVDPGTFMESASLIVAGQSGRKSKAELISETPADGLIGGIASINNELFSSGNKTMVISYDYTVLAGTQGGFNHKKTDRLIRQARQLKLPIVFFVEGGGGRPGDVDFDPITIGGLDISTFVEYARLKGHVPRIAIVNGYCFAGNAALAGCSDVIIATKNSNLGMGGPAMIEGGGLGRFHPKEIGPAETHSKNGTIDICVGNEEEAVAITKKCLAMFQGSINNFNVLDQQLLRETIPENRKFAYDIYKVIKTLADEESLVEIKKEYALNMVTTFARIEGKPVGIIANSSRHLGGAIDHHASEKACQFITLCDSFRIPILSLCDTPGFMVGPEIEAKGMVKFASKLFTVGAGLKVPVMTVILRKAYGLGAMAMAGGSLHESIFTIAWPTAEFGAMGLEGAVKLGFSKELSATADLKSKQVLYEQLVSKAYQKGKAIEAASKLEFDEVIDPKDTRQWILTGLKWHDVQS